MNVSIGEARVAGTYNTQTDRRDEKQSRRSVMYMESRFILTLANYASCSPVFLR